MVKPIKTEYQVMPISPEQVAAKRRPVIPPEVIEAFNELIVLEYRGQCAIIDRVDAEKMIMMKMPRGTVFNNEWLDIEEVYYRVGWHVFYEQAEDSYSRDLYTFKPRRL